MNESKLLKCLLEENRRNILKFLGDGEKTVGEIVEFLGKEQPVVSHHLASLRRCGLVTARKEGKNVKYRVSNPKITTLLQNMEKLAQEIMDKGEC